MNNINNQLIKIIMSFMLGCIFFINLYNLNTLSNLFPIEWIIIFSIVIITTYSLFLAIIILLVSFISNLTEEEDE
jgi:hypothetical protein